MSCFMITNSLKNVQCEENLLAAPLCTLNILVERIDGVTQAFTVMPTAHRVGAGKPAAPFGNFWEVLCGFNLLHNVYKWVIHQTNLLLMKKLFYCHSVVMYIAIQHAIPRLWHKTNCSGERKNQTVLSLEAIFHIVNKMNILWLFCRQCIVLSRNEYSAVYFN